MFNLYLIWVHEIIFPFPDSSFNPWTQPYLITHYDECKPSILQPIFMFRCNYGNWSNSNSLNPARIFVLIACFHLPRSAETRDEHQLTLTAVRVNSVTRGEGMELQSIIISNSEIHSEISHCISYFRDMGQYTAAVLWLGVAPEIWIHRISPVEIEWRIKSF